LTGREPHRDQAGVRRSWPLDVNRTVAAQRMSRGDVLVEFGQHRTGPA